MAKYYKKNLPDGWNSDNNCLSSLFINQIGDYVKDLAEYLSAKQVNSTLLCIIFPWLMFKYNRFKITFLYPHNFLYTCEPPQKYWK